MFFFYYCCVVLCFQAKVPDVGFLKIHAPWHVLCREAEFMKLKMPTKKVCPGLEIDRVSGAYTAYTNQFLPFFFFFRFRNMMSVEEVTGYAQ